MLDLAQVNKERTEEFVPGIERAVPKKNGVNFTMELHNFAILFKTALDAEQDANEYWSLLKSIDSQALNRNYAPPALTIPKPQPKERRILPSSVSIPFGVSPDDEDFDEESVGTEVEFLPSSLLDPDSGKASRDDDLFDNNKTKKQKAKKESTPEKITSTPTRIENKPTTPQIQKNVVNKKTEPTTPPNKNTSTKKNPKELTPKQQDKKIKTTEKNNTKQNQKSTPKQTKKINQQDKKNDTKQNTTQNTNKIANDKNKQINKPTKTTNTKNNNKKIVRIVAKESKSVTKQLQKKRPK
jgi:hypothetical protein